MSTNKRIQILSCVIFSLIFMGIGSIAYADTANADTVHYYGVVKEGPLNVRSGPGTSYAALGKISEGTKITVTSTTVVNDVKWYRFSYQSKSGYVCGKYVQVYASQVFFSKYRTATIFQGPLNVRSGPSTNSAIIGSAPYLKVVSVKSLYYKYGSGKWLRTTWNGKTGYLAAQYVLMNTAGVTIKKYTSTTTGVVKVTTSLKNGPGTAYGGNVKLASGKTAGFVGEVINSSGGKWLLYRYAYAIYYVNAKDISFAAQTVSTNAQKIVSLAYSKLGCAYVYGTEGPNTFDCSGFVYWVVNNSGISGLSVPRTSDDLYSKYKAYSVGTNIANARPGDVILFSNNGSASGICHSAIYYKDGRMIHASSPDTGVILTTVAYSTSNKSVFAIIRLPGL
jgi:cell wall-associated NlpC family hydrolase